MHSTIWTTARAARCTRARDREDRNGSGSNWRAAVLGGRMGSTGGNGERIGAEETPAHHIFHGGKRGVPTNRLSVRFLLAVHAGAHCNCALSYMLLAVTGRLGLE